MSLRLRRHVPSESKIKWYSAMQSHVFFAIKQKLNQNHREKPRRPTKPNPV